MFTQLVENCNKLNEIGQLYLAQFEHENKSFDDLAQAILNAAWDKVEKLGFTESNWLDCGDDELIEIIDAGVPYTNFTRNGSLHYSLGWAMAAQEANLRAFYEYFVNGKEKKLFTMLADL